MWIYTVCIQFAQKWVGEKAIQKRQQFMEEKILIRMSIDKHVTRT